MTLFNIILVLGGLILAVLPYALLCRLAGRSLSAGGSITLGLALFVLISAPVVAMSFKGFLVLHAVITVIAVVGRIRRIGPIQQSTFDPWLLLIVLLTVVSRLVPPLVGGDALGMGDARYHNLIARLIQIHGSMPTTWQPFADIGIMYPQGIHTLLATASTITGRPVHEIFMVAFAPVAGLTTLALFRLTRLVCDSVSAGRLAAAAFAFLPTWNSLDYYAWGGLPNAIAMLFLVEFLFRFLSEMGSTRPHSWHRYLPHAILAAAIIGTHHYTLIILILLGLACLLCLNAESRRDLVYTALLTLPCAAFVLTRQYLGFSDSVGNTGVFVYREQIFSLIAVISGLSIPLTFLVALALWLRRRATWTRSQLVILTWLALLLLTYISLAYGYRAVVLWLTAGQDMFTAFTPSRMAAILVYPMSILVGLLAPGNEPRMARDAGTNPTAIHANGIETMRNSGPGKWRRVFLVCFTAACVLMTSAGLSSQLKGDAFPSATDAGRWLHEHSPTNAMVVGVYPFLEYTAWRETSEPPLPASEQRLAPSVLQKKERKTYTEWQDWSRETGRQVYFALPPLAQPPPSFVACHSNADIIIYTATP